MSCLWGLSNVKFAKPEKNLAFLIVEFTLSFEGALPAGKIQFFTTVLITAKTTAFVTLMLQNKAENELYQYGVIR